MIINNGLPEGIEHCLDMVRESVGTGYMVVHQQGVPHCITIFEDFF